MKTKKTEKVYNFLSLILRLVNFEMDLTSGKSNFFVHFLGELKIQKRHFEVVSIVLWSIRPGK